MSRRERNFAPKPPGHYARIIAVLVFALAGAISLGLWSPWILNEIFVWATKLNGTEVNPELRYTNATSPASIVPLTLLGGLAGAWIGLRLLRFGDSLADKWEKMDSGDKVSLFLGIFVGIIMALPFLVLFQALQINGLYIPLLIIGLTLGFSSLSVYALHSMDEILPWSKDKGRHRRTGIKILDTNVIIDGRIYEVARTGFLEGQLYVPGFVLDELQHIADDHNALRRQRGRRGLEVLRHMQADFPLEVRIHDRLVPDPSEPVDSRLVKLAKALGGDIVTNDFNLNRVAALQEVKVLNLNDLAISLRSNVLPQEKLTLPLIREGNQPGQGVGYLEDGTMVVVEHGKPFVGSTIEVTVTQVIQTERGKMIFGEVGDDEEPSERRKPRRTS